MGEVDEWKCHRRSPCGEGRDLKQNRVPIPEFETGYLIIILSLNDPNIGMVQLRAAKSRELLMNFAV